MFSFLADILPRTKDFRRQDLLDYLVKLGGEGINLKLLDSKDALIEFLKSRLQETEKKKAVLEKMTIETDSERRWLCDALRAALDLEP